jgi:apolipoprotein N-acyltransferase
MLQILKSRNALVVLVVAIVVAYISAKPFAQANAWVAIPWGILALLIAYLAKNKKESLILGGLFGFVVSYSYLWFNDTSSYTFAKIVFLICLIILPSAFGMLCGLLASWLGWTIKSKTMRKTM